MYHANYLVWFEAGRAESMRSCGIPYTELDNQGIYLPVIDVHIRYHRPALYDQLVEVWTHIIELTRTKVHFGYKLRLAGDPALLATGHTIHAVIGPGGRVMRLDRSPDLWQRLQAAAARLGEDEG